VLPPPDPSFRGRIEVALEDSTGEFPEPLEAPQGAPNVLLVMGDDIGYGHMSGFGGPADTPVFDRLATQGLRFTNFHTTAVCAASRAALLTGRNAHSVGMGAIPEGSIGFPGYNAVIPRSAATARTGTAPPWSASPTAPRCMRSRPRDRSTGGRGAWVPSTSTASTARV
jgi:arylsulfatase